MKHVCRTLLFLLAAQPTAAFAEVKLPNVLSDHMVLQRGAPVPIWGTAAPGEQVTVKIRDQTKTATADTDGKWAVKLDILKAGGPDVLTVTGKNSLELKDVLVGDVWVGSGQSNMAGTVGGYAKGDPVLAKLAAASYPQLRFSKSGGKWNESNDKSNLGASAILFAFGVRLQQELNVPVGLMVGAVGGTPSGYWLSDAAFRSDDGVKAVVKAALPQYDPAAAKANHEKQLAKWEVDTAAAKKDNKPLPRKPAAPTPPGESNGKIGNLYETHIRPMQPFAIRGVLWDQGESGTAVNGVDQFALMGALIKGWRKEWGQDFPFIYIQKPSGMGCAFDPDDPVTNKADKYEPLPKEVPNDGASRALYVSLMKHPDTYMATASDLGPMVHPTNKSGYGTRAARVALGAVYGKKIEIYGPVYKSHVVEGNKIRVMFDHIGQGLTSKHGEKLQGFAIAGADGKFVWAEAMIEGDAIVVSNAQVEKPVSLRYAFANKHTWANLFNKDGLPALPFTTEVPPVKK
ncbi:sialate O-acetylesterase [soil metagenome]